MIAQVSSDGPAPRSRAKAGKATLTTEPSMKAMLDPRIVAASVRPGWAVAAGPVAVAVPASHGPARAAVMLRVSNRPAACMAGGTRPPQATSGERNWCTAWITTEPSPTPDATRFTEPERTSPMANSPGLVVA